MLNVAAFQPKGFEGVMLAASLADVIQMECLSMATRAVRVDRGDISGRIYFTGGQIVHAEVGTFSGEEALFEILHWTKGSFQFEEGVRAMDETINRSWESLLMEAAHRADESGGSRVTAFPLNARAMNTNHIAEVFKDPEILEAVHFDSSGSITETKGGDPEALQGTAAYVIQLLQHIGHSLGAEHLHEVHLIGTSQRVLCTNSEDGTTAIVASGKSNLTTLAKKLHHP